MDNDFTPGADPEEVKTTNYEKNQIIFIRFNLDQTVPSWSWFNTT
jgi:hypothetical protein